MGFYKDFKNYFKFRKEIKKNKDVLLSKFNLKIDNANRLYTIVNVPSNLVEEPYNLRKSDVDIISQNYIREYISELSKYLNSIGLYELYDYYDQIKKVDKYSYLLVFGYKQIKSTKLFIAFYSILSLLIILIITLLNKVI